MKELFKIGEQGINGLYVKTRLGRVERGLLLSYRYSCSTPVKTRLGRVERTYAKLTVDFTDGVLKPD